LQLNRILIKVGCNSVQIKMAFLQIIIAGKNAKAASVE
jgi:hypothetical protein